MNEKKPVSITMPILYWVCSVMWSINAVLHLYSDGFAAAPIRNSLDIVLAVLWIALAIGWTIRYRNSRK